MGLVVVLASAVRTHCTMAEARDGDGDVDMGAPPGESEVGDHEGRRRRKGPARGAGTNRAHVWHVDLQNNRRATRAHCFHCKEMFEVGELRLHSARTRHQANRFFHMMCVPADIHTPESCSGYAELTPGGRGLMAEAVNEMAKRGRPRAGRSRTPAPTIRRPGAVDAMPGARGSGACGSAQDPRLATAAARSQEGGTGGPEPERCGGEPCQGPADAMPGGDRRTAGPTGGGGGGACQGSADATPGVNPRPRAGPSLGPDDMACEDDDGGSTTTGGATQRQGDEEASDWEDEYLNEQEQEAGDWESSLEWWDRMDWNVIRMLDTPTSPIVTASVKHAISTAKAQVADFIHRVTMRGDRQGLARGWKLMVAMDGLIFGEVRGTMESSRREQLAERLEMFDKGQWGPLWHMASPVRGAGGGPQEDEEVQCAKKVQQLLEVGEVSRAASTVWASPGLATADQVVTKLRGTQRERVERPEEGPRAIDPEMKAALIEKIAKSFGRYPRRSGAGPAGGRYEHWGMLADDPTMAKKVAEVLVQAVTGEMPQEALTTVLSASLCGIPKKNGGVRTLGRGGVIRRMVGRAVAKECRDEIKQAVGDRQFGLQEDGCGRMHRLVCGYAATRQDKVVVSCDLSDAFSCISRRAVVKACRERAPKMAPIATSWCTEPSMHVVTDNADAASSRVFMQTDGLDQGCPLSPALFCIAIAPVLDEVRAAMRAVDPDAEVVAYLDDVYLLGSPAAVERGLQALEEGMRGIGMRLNHAKTQVWTKNPAMALPESLRPKRVQTLSVVGAEVPYARADRSDPERDWRDVPVLIGGGRPNAPPRSGSAGSGSAVASLAHSGPAGSGSAVASPAQGNAAPGGAEGRAQDEEARVEELDDQAFLDRQREYFLRLIRLNRSGLPIIHVLTLMRTWTQGAGVHLVRGNLMRKQWAEAVDMQVIEMMQELLGTEIGDQQQSQVFLKMADGGMGMGSMVDRRLAAWVGAWEAGVGAVAEAVGIGSYEQLCAAWPEWRATMSEADDQLARATGATFRADRWAARLAEAGSKKQRDYTRAVQAKRARTLHGALVAYESEKVRGGGGKGGGNFMVPVTTEEKEGTAMERTGCLGDKHAVVAIRRRLRCAEVAPNMGPTCGHRTRRGVRCGHRMTGDGGAHATSCGVGGGMGTRHDAIRDLLLEWLRAHGYAARKEQHVPHWDRQVNGREERAILDIVYTDTAGHAVYLDVTVVGDGDPGAGRPRGRVRTRELRKHARYPGAGMWPLVLDSRGAWGKEAATWLKAAVGHMPGGVEAVKMLRYEVSRTLQQGVAEQILSAAQS